MGINGEAKFAYDEKRSVALQIKELEQMPDISAEEAESKLAALLNEYAVIFEEPTVSKLPEVEIHVDPATRPINVQTSSRSKAEWQIIEDYVRDEHSKGHVEPGNGSDWNFNPVIVKKKVPDSVKDPGLRELWRVCINFAPLNPHMQEYKFPLPKLESLLDSLAGAKYFSSMDLRAAFSQMSVKPEHRKYLAFSTRTNKWQFTVSIVGTNA
jgi:hypothetical protein